MTFKDWITITLSVLAFTISAATAYFSLSERRQLLAIANGTIVPDHETLKLGDSQTVAFTFSNPGNRRVAVTGLSLSALQISETATLRGECPQLSDDSNENSNLGLVWSAYTDDTFPPIILQPGEIVFHRQIFNGGLPGNEDGVVSALPGERSARVVTCIIFYVLTEEGSSRVERRLGQFTMTKSELGTSMSSQMGTRTQKFMVLINDTGFFLGSSFRNEKESTQQEERGEP
ncbi:hypothetical protein [Rhizobium leguminosarum]|uniref:hypothetical protein n=1 Tax=Rhizobium leguminosarum TaxID=384 RepID=UPI000485C8BF|nr:hypothetical protein [Rhizobium leguminosarum]WFT88403.1 hypothetical protein QA638_12705 [Rhizobium leguminosarum]